MRFLLLLLSFLFSSCTPVIVGSSMGGTFCLGTFIAQDTKKSERFSDFWIANNIRYQLLSQKKEFLTSVSIKVFEAKVLCLGEVSSSIKKKQILDIIKQVKGVQAIFDEIKIIKTPKYDILDRLRDSRITLLVKSNIMFNKNFIAFQNYNVSTFKQKVFLTGFAKSSLELSQVLFIASKIQYVKEVKNYIRV